MEMVESQRMEWERVMAKGIEDEWQKEIKGVKENQQINKWKNVFSGFKKDFQKIGDKYFGKESQ